MVVLVGKTPALQAGIMGSSPIRSSFHSKPESRYFCGICKVLGGFFDKWCCVASGWLLGLWKRFCGLGFLCFFVGLILAPSER